MHPPFAFKVMCMKKQDAELRQQEMLEKPVERLIVRMVIYALSDFLIMILSWLVKQSLRAFLFQEVQP